MKYLGLTLLILAFATSQFLIGGARLLFCLPAYGLIAMVAICAVIPRWRTGSPVPIGSLLISLLFFGYVGARTCFSPVEYLARNDLFIVLGALMMYLLTVLFFVRTGDRRILILGLLGLAMAHVVVAAIQFREVNQFMPFAWMQRPDKGWRASGFYISPNHFAGLIEIIALFAFSIAVWGKRSLLEKVLLIYVGLCCVVGVAVSGSRGGYLALIGGTVCLLVLSLWTCRYFYRGRWTLIAGSTLAAAFLVCAIAGTVMFQSATLRQRFFEINEPGNMRFRLWDAALAQFHLDPVWGTGSGTYLYYGRTFRDPRVQNDPVFVHNDYLHLLAEYGLVGAAGFLLFFAWHGVTGLRAIGALARRANDFRETRDDALALHLGAMSAVGAYVIHSAVDFNLHIPANALVMAMVFGVVANPGVAATLPTRGNRITAGGMRVVLFVIAIFVLVYGMPLIRGEWYAERARQALRNYQLPEARALAAEALKYEQSNPEIYYYGGEAAREMASKTMGNVEELQKEAVAMFQKGLGVFPDDSRTLVKLGEAYDQSKRFDEAEEVLAQAYEIDPNSVYVHAYYGMHYQAEGSLMEAANEFQIAKELDANSEFQIVQIGFAEIQKLLESLQSTPPVQASEAMEAGSEPEPDEAAEAEDPVKPDDAP